MPADRTVPIRSLGIVAPGATGVDAFFELLKSGHTAISPIPAERFDTSALRSSRAGIISGFSPRDFISPARLRRMNQSSRLAMAAARMAIESSGITDLADRATGLALGTAFGPVETSVRYFDEYLDKGPGLAPPQLFAESVANAPGSHIAIEWGLTGFNVTFTQSVTSALLALGFAGLQIAKETTSTALVGGVEEINEIIYEVLDRIGALARGGGDLDEAIRPFDRRRNGVLPGEGSAFFVLSDRDSDGAPLCRLSRFATGRDTTATLSDWGSGSEAVAKTMSSAIFDAGLQPADISAVWASANGSRKGDAVEAEALLALFGRRCPPVVATKGCFGEWTGGGAHQIASAILGLRHQILFPSPGFHESDLGEIPVTTTTAEHALDHILINAIAPGGAVVSAVLSR